MLDKIIMTEKQARNYRTLNIATFEIRADRVEFVCDTIDEKLYDVDCYSSENLDAVFTDNVEVIEADGKSYIKAYLCDDLDLFTEDQLLSYITANLCHLYNDETLFFNARLFA